VKFMIVKATSPMTAVFLTAPFWGDVVVDGAGWPALGVAG
jgi:hypothetical protein